MVGLFAVRPSEDEATGKKALRNYIKRLYLFDGHAIWGKRCSFPFLPFFMFAFEGGGGETVMCQALGARGFLK